MRRAVRLLFAFLAGTAIVLLFVLPGRTLLAQRSSLAVTERQIAALSTENSKLQAEAKALRTTSNIEQLAREQFGLVLPGQEAYAIIPAVVSPPSTRAVARRNDHSSQGVGGG